MSSKNRLVKTSARPLAAEYSSPAAFSPAGLSALSAVFALSLLCATPSPAQQPGATTGEVSAAAAAVSAASGPAAPAQLSAGQIAKITGVINRFAELIYEGKTAEAAKLCINPHSGFLSKDFISEFQSSRGTPLKIRDIGDAAGDTISVVLEFGSAQGDLLTQEFVLIANPRGEGFLIANIFDRLYEKINEEKKACLSNCYFIENALYYFRRITAGHSFSKDFSGRAAIKKLADAGFFVETPKCPAGGEYSCSVSFDAETGAYEVMIGCNAHGSLAEISRLYTNLDNSERLFADFDRAVPALAAKYCGERLAAMFRSASLEKSFLEFIRTENISEAVAAFNKLHGEEKNLGELYPALSDALTQNGHDTEAAALLREAAALYPDWQLIREKLKEFGGNQ